MHLANQATQKISRRKFLLFSKRGCSFSYVVEFAIPSLKEFFHPFGNSVTLGFVVFSFWGLGTVSTIDNLTKSWSFLTLSEHEGSDLRLTKDEAAPEFVLAAKFLTKCALNIDAIANTFNLIWRSRNGFKVKKEDNHVALFTFDNKEEMEQILSIEP